MPARRVCSLSFAWLLALAATHAGATPCETTWHERLRAGQLRVAHYPSRTALRAYLDLSSVPGSEGLGAAKLTVERPNDPRPVVEVSVDARAATAPGGFQTIVELPRLAPGEWIVRARFRPADCPAGLAGPEARFETRSFGWEANGLGNDPGVIPPFTPLAVRGRRVDTVLREHQIHGSGTWTQVVAAGRPLLVDPMRWTVVTDGAPREIVASEPEITAVRPDRVSVRSRFTAGPLSLQLTGEFEMDGLYRIRLDVRGNPSTRVDRLDLVVPLAPERATLMNAITDETRIHRLGAVPAGKGSVWRSAEAPRRQLDAGFVPYLWVGDEERGLAWIAESTRDFWFAPGDSMAELRRLGKAVELVVHFAPRPGPLARDRSFAFALQATPIKPRPDHAGPWRRWQLACDAGPDAVGVCPLPAGFYWGTETRYGNVTPRDSDESVFRWMAQARTGRPPSVDFGSWLDRKHVPAADRAEALASLEYSMRVLAMPSKAAVVYMNAQGTAWGPEFAVYTDEWRPAPFGDRQGGDEPSVRELPVVPRRSYQDRLLWHLDRLLASGAADGVFFDNTFLRASWDDYVGTAYRDERGRLHPGVEIHALRDLLRRAQTLVHQRRGGWWNVAHLTTTPISAIHGWAGINLDGEWQYGQDDYQKRFPRDLLRASALGAQLGTVPVWLQGVHGVSGPRQVELERQQFGVTALHEIRVMATQAGPLGEGWQLLRKQGYGDPACEVGRYWDERPLVTVAGVDAKVLSIRCGDRITALVVGFDDGGTAELSVAGASAGVRCSDLERRWERITASERGCRIALARHGVRLIEMRTR